MKITDYGYWTQVTIRNHDYSWGVPSKMKKWFIGNVDAEAPGFLADVEGWELDCIVKYCNGQSFYRREYR